MGRIIGFNAERELDRIARQAVIPAVDETTQAMVRVAAAVARRDTGRMAEGWESVPAQRNGSVVHGAMKNDVPYTAYQDFGTSTITPNRMSGQAIDAEAPSLPSRIKARL